MQDDVRAQRCGRARVGRDHLGIVCQRSGREHGDASARLHTHHALEAGRGRPIGGPRPGRLGAPDLGKQCERHSKPAAHIDQRSPGRFRGEARGQRGSSMIRRPPQIEAL